jgi:hypothetical protein
MLRTLMLEGDTLGFTPAIESQQPSESVQLRCVSQEIWRYLLFKRHIQELLKDDLTQNVRS